MTHAVITAALKIWAIVVLLGLAPLLFALLLETEPACADVQVFINVDTAISTFTQITNATWSSLARRFSPQLSIHANGTRIIFIGSAGNSPPMAAPAAILPELNRRSFK